MKAGGFRVLVPAVLIAAGALLTAAPPWPGAGAQGFREIRRIPAPQQPSAAPPAPEGARLLAEPVAIDPKVIEAAARKVVASWNQGDLGQYLADDFQNRERLLDAIAGDVPRDAVIRVLAIRNVKTFDQYARRSADGNEIVTHASAQIDTQVEYEDPKAGLRRLRGSGEYMFELIFTP